jgi:hypothetical protein
LALVVLVVAAVATTLALTERYRQLQDRDGLPLLVLAALRAFPQGQTPVLLVVTQAMDSSAVLA